MERYDIDSTRNSPRPWEVPVTESQDSDAANNVSDSIERRRMQNRLAQRNHRRRVRAHISALEQRVVEDMLNAAPNKTNVPAPSIENTMPPASLASPPSLLPPALTSPASQYQAFTTLTNSVASQSNPGIEEMPDFMEFPQTVDDAIQTGQFPPVVEYFAHVVFHEVCATHIISGPGPSSECQLLTKVLYDIALLGTGQAFRELHTEIHPDGQFVSRSNITQPTLGHSPWDFIGQPIACSYSENALDFGDDMSNVALALLDLPTTVSKHASSLNPAEA
ncbi:hypothetical protein OIDMADRAFT_181266 [Oidiodendron maius Zn]|uniref:BZIP domain-containing protein n=1 Tax=Oidiodendron maius (strain Zn) TaxID=913774 RepID=A0A0C3HCC2_OIDMZ|nr:hypothetical protein OIDMADRAFT_181266 [Oidiodendron maius Zn]